MTSFIGSTVLNAGDLRRASVLADTEGNLFCVCA